MSLATFVSRIKALENFAFDVAKEAAPLVQEAIRGRIRAGIAPDGTPWPAKKLGGRALKDADHHVTATSAGDRVLVTLSGVEVFHDKGNGRLPKREMLPKEGKLPDYIADALHEGAKRALAKRGAR